jgi:hypothetical protein
MNFTRAEVEELATGKHSLLATNPDIIVRQLAEDWLEWSRETGLAIAPLFQAVDDATCSARETQRAIDVLKNLP